MKFISIFGLALILMFAVESCTNEAGSSSGQSSASIKPSITSEKTKENIQKKKEPVVSIALPADSLIYVEDFLRLFKFAFKRNIDFGWRFIASNYEEFASDSSFTTTIYDTENDLDDYAWLTNNENAAIGKVWDIGYFSGYAHSYTQKDDNYIFITYQMGEINESLHCYYVDKDFNLIHEEELARVAGDEGTWFSSFGSFSEDFAVYSYSYISGEGLDTMDSGAETILFQ